MALFKQLGVTCIQATFYVNTGAYNGCYASAATAGPGDQTLLRGPRPAVIIDKNCAYGTITATQIGQAWVVLATSPPASPSASVPTTWEVMSYGDMARQPCALKWTWLRATSMSPRAASPGTRIHRAALCHPRCGSLGLGQYPLGQESAGSSMTACCGSPSGSPVGAETLATHYSVSCR